MGDVGAVYLVGLRREAALLRPGARVVIGETGLAAALAAGASGVVSFGVCGALDPGIAVGEMVIGEAVSSARGEFAADGPWTARLAKALPHARRGRFAGVDAPAASRADKAALRKTTGAVAVDMESHLVASHAAAAGVPFAIVRAVSDGAAHDLPAAAVAGFRADGRADIGAVLRALARRPWELPALLRTARDAAAAITALARHAEAIRACEPKG